MVLLKHWQPESVPRLGSTSRWGQRRCCGGWFRPCPRQQEDDRLAGRRLGQTGFASVGLMEALTELEGSGARAKGAASRGCNADPRRQILERIDQEPPRFFLSDRRVHSRALDLLGGSQMPAQV